MTGSIDPRRGWCAAGVLLLSAGLLSAVAHLMFWWPCRGWGDPLGCAARATHWLTPPFMPDPVSRVAGVVPALAVSSLLAAAAWPVALLSSRLGRGLRVFGLMVAVQPVSVGVWSVVSGFTSLVDPELRVSRLWWLSGEVLALVFVAVLFVAEDFFADGNDELAKERGWLVVVLVGATTFGMVRWMLELLAFGGNLGDGVPHPGAGAGMVATLLLTGSVAVFRSRRLVLQARNSWEPSPGPPKDHPLPVDRG